MKAIILIICIITGFSCIEMTQNWAAQLAGGLIVCTCIACFVFGKED
jgi:hypothetical protein